MIRLSKTKMLTGAFFLMSTLVISPIVWSKKLSPVTLVPIDTATQQALWDTDEPLDFETFMTLVNQNHPLLLMADLERQKASAKRLEKQGAFDPYIKADGDFRRFNSSSAPGKAQESFTSEYTANLLTRYGFSVKAGSKLNRGDIKTPVSPTGEGGEYFWGVDVPLLRDRGINPKFAAEKKAKVEESAADAVFQRKRLKLLDESIKTYWSWLAANQIFGVYEELLGLGVVRRDAIGQRADAGDLPQIAMVEAEREVRKRTRKLRESQRNQQQARIAMGLFLWTPVGEPVEAELEEQAALVNVPLPSPLPLDLITQGKITAIKKRPEIRVLDFAQTISQIDVDLSKNQLLPQLDAFITQGTQTGDLGIGPVYRAGVQMLVPLRYRTPLGQLRQAKLDLEKLTVQERQLLQEVFVSVEDAVSEWQTAYDRYLAAREEYEFALALEEGERTKFEYGDSTIFLVNQRERSRAESNRALIKAKTDFFKAKARYQVAIGQL